MSARSVCRSQEDVGGAGVDLQEAKMSLPRLVKMQTANIPPEERTSDDLYIYTSDDLSIPFHFLSMTSI